MVEMLVKQKAEWRVEQKVILMVVKTVGMMVEL